MPRLVPTDSTDPCPTDFETRALAAVMGPGRLGEAFMSALRRANQLFGAALLLQVADLRRAGDPVERALARTKELELQLSFAYQTIDVLLDRLNRVPPAHRPHYRKAARGRILHHKDVLHLSCREVARLYALTPDPASSRPQCERLRALVRDDSLSLPDRVDPLLRRKRFTRAALSAFLHASEALAMAFGRKLGQMRASGDSFAVYLARIEELEHRNRIHARVTPLLQARLRRVLDGKSDHYLDTERWEILQIRRDACLTQEETAQLFLQSVSTIADWERQARNSPDREGRIGTLLSPTPPIRRAADVVRSLIQAMALLGFDSPGSIARWIYRGGYEVSRAFVQNVLDEPPAASLDSLAAFVTPPPLPAAKAPRAVKAKRPMHVALADVTDIPRSFGKPPLKLFAFYDVFSRMPLAWRLLEADPTAQEAVSLLVEVIAKHGKTPVHFVCDQGSYFTAPFFQQKLRELGIKVRFGALGQHGSIALIERFWKTEKSLLLPTLPVDKELTRQDVLPRLELSIDYYSHFRPHSSLGNRTPAEVFYGRPLPVPSPARAPRGRPGDPSPDLGVTITFLDSERLFPILVRKAA